MGSRRELHLQAAAGSSVRKQQLGGMHTGGGRLRHMWAVAGALCYKELCMWAAPGRCARRLVHHWWILLLTTDPP